jgi:hypothetical protein
VTLRALVPLLLAGCWNTEPDSLATDQTDFLPDVEEELEGWSVSRVETPLVCPDGQSADFWVLHPTDAEDDARQPVAIVFHSGAFDYVLTPSEADPVAGAHYADPSQLDAEWAAEQAFVTLGMYPSADERESHMGTLAYALAEVGVNVLIPVNCWGDRWHNAEGVVDNDTTVDLFARNGRSAAEFAYKLAADPDFAVVNGVKLPVTFSPDDILVFGLGEGSRAVSELITIDENADGTPDHTPIAAVVDSPIDDLNVYYEMSSIFPDIAIGLDRIFAGESTDIGSFSSAPLPPRIGYVYSSLDTLIPSGANVGLAAALAEHPNSWVLDTAEQQHVHLNGNLEVARQAVTFARGE